LDSIGVCSPKKRFARASKSSQKEDMNENLKCIRCTKKTPNRQILKSMKLSNARAQRLQVLTGSAHIYSANISRMLRYRCSSVVVPQYTGSMTRTLSYLKSGLEATSCSVQAIIGSLSSLNRTSSRQKRIQGITHP
jgi:ribosomal protein S26